MKNSKTTIATLYGVDEAKKQLNGLIEEAKLMLKPFCKKATTLLELTDFIKNRHF